MTFCLGAVAQHTVDLADAEVVRWQAELVERLDHLLGRSPSPTERCFLLEIRGHVSVFLTKDRKRSVAPNLDAVFEYWSELPRAAKHAPLYPLERLSNRLTQFITLFGDDPRLGPLTEKIDALLAKRSGLIRAAEKARDRAIAFYKRGQRVRAIDELHRVKLSWFAEEALGGCCLALLLLSQWYLELGLSFAGKYHALAAAFIGLHNRDESLRRFCTLGIVGAADCAYVQGCWFDFLDFAKVASSSVFAVPSTSAEGIQEAMQRTLLHTTVLRVLAERFGGDLTVAVQAYLNGWELGGVGDGLLPEARALWAELNEDQLWARFSELAGRPFSDVGPRRSVEWKQLGITWTVQWDNSYGLTARAEQFVAVLQILLCKAAGKDLCLLKAAVQIEFCMGDVRVPKVVPVGGNDVRRWHLIWPAGVKTDGNAKVLTAMEDALSVAMMMLLDISLLRDAQFEQVARKLFREGLSSTIYTAKSYEVLYREFVSEVRPHGTSLARLEPPGLCRPFTLRQASELRPCEGPGPGYSKRGSEEAVLRRYRTIPPLIRHTLKRLNADEEFRRTVAELRSEGWLDWHLLLAIANAVMNYRAKGTPPDQTAWREMSRNFVAVPEQEEWEPIPVSEFTRDKLKFFLRASVVSTVVHAGLANRHGAPLFDAIFDLLGSRYGYWSDDVPHDQLFA